MFKSIIYLFLIYLFSCLQLISTSQIEEDFNNIISESKFYTKERTTFEWGVFLDAYGFIMMKGYTVNPRASTDYTLILDNLELTFGLLYGGTSGSGYVEMKLTYEQILFSVKQIFFYKPKWKKPDIKFPNTIYEYLESEFVDKFKEEKQKYYQDKYEFLKVLEN